ncbi:MAG: hypothetical protein KF823_11730 [Xanthomonadales bacterium]|nr:hypothetical protein [Xanthomonadales bacterium]
MRPIRLSTILLVLALAGCASHGSRHYGYYPRDASVGDYYVDRAVPAARWSVGIGYGAGWYDPYDALFWGVRYSYWDPFWFPYFHYGVTWYPRWYYGGYWGWRGWHPYSPWYGSWWDHYYAWHHAPRRPGYRASTGAHTDPQRFGSARNAAERMAASRRGLDGLGRFDAGVGAGIPQNGGRWQRRDGGLAAPGLAPGDRSDGRFQGRPGELRGMPDQPVTRPFRGDFTPPPGGRAGREGGAAPARRGELPARTTPAPARSADWSGRNDGRERGIPSMGRSAAPERGGQRRDLPVRQRD